MAGRPSKLTPETATRIVDAIRAGCYAQVAAQAAGVGKTTYFDWRARGREARGMEPVPRSERPYVDFVNQLEKAEADAELRLVVHVVAAAPKDWRAAIEVLRRRFPERWNAELDDQVRQLEQERELLIASVLDAIEGALGDAGVVDDTAQDVRRHFSERLRRTATPTARRSD